MTRIILLCSLSAAVVLGQTKAPAAKIPIVVYKTPACGCCTKWVEHMEKNGFAATVHVLPDVSAERAKAGVPSDLASCHTSVVRGYAIEGHVPAEDVKRLLQQKPKVAGLSAPGMPPGSPGMDVPNSPPFEVVAFDKQGHSTVFATHR